MGGFRENAAGYIGRMTREALAIGGTITFTEEKGREIHIGALHYQALFRREQEESRCPFLISSGSGSNYGKGTRRPAGRKRSPRSPAMMAASGEEGLRGHFRFSKYHFVAAARPVLTLNSGAYPSSRRALSMQARLCGMSPARFGP